MEFMARHNFIPCADEYVAYDRETNVPVAAFQVRMDQLTGLKFRIHGSASIVSDLAEQCIKNVRFSFDGLEDDYRFPAKTIVGFQRDPAGRAYPVVEMTPMSHNRVVHDEYYPSIVGGPIGLIRSFMESSASVLILSGPPGTGKTSAITYAARKLNLMATFATNINVIKDEAFVRTIFREQDDRNSGFAFEQHASARSHLFSGMTISGLHNPFKRADDYVRNGIQEELQRRTGMRADQMRPVSVVEDADLLLRPRSDGNEQMSDLLNYSDGATGGSHRKIIFTTNLESPDAIEPALLRSGRCFGLIDVRKLASTEVVAVRRKAGKSPIPPEQLNEFKMWTLAEVLNYADSNDNSNSFAASGSPFQTPGLFRTLN